MTELPPADIPEVELVIRHEQKKEQESAADTTSSEPDTKGQIINFVPPPVSELDEPAALNKKVTNKCKIDCFSILYQEAVPIQT